MNFLITDSFVKIEILFLLICLAYLAFSIIYESFSIFIIMKNIVKPKRIILEDEQIKAVIEEKLEQIEEEQLSDETPYVPETSQDKNTEELQDNKSEQEDLTKDQKDILIEIARIAQTKINR